MYDTERMEGLAAERLRFDAEADSRAAWLAGYAAANARETLVLGLSGGKDSALVGWLAKRSGIPLVAAYLECGSSQDDLAAARAVAGWLEPDEYFEIRLDAALSGFAESMYWTEPGVLVDPVDVGNAKARLRMMALYSIARGRCGLVLGTGNATEAALGYYTKYGDGGYDINPVADLLWSEARAMLRWAGVPALVLDRPSSAGLWEGQTDEGEMGLSYADADAYLLGLPVEGGPAAAIAARVSAYGRKGSVLDYGRDRA